MLRTNDQQRSQRHCVLHDLPFRSRNEAEDAGRIELRMFSILRVASSNTEQIFAVPSRTFQKYQFSTWLPWFIKRWILRQKTATLRPLYQFDKGVAGADPSVTDYLPGGRDSPDEDVVTEAKA